MSPNPFRLEPDVVVEDNGTGFYSITKNCHGSCIHNITSYALTLVLGDLVDRMGHDLVVCWIRLPTKKKS